MAVADNLNPASVDGIRAAEIISAADLAEAIEKTHALLSSSNIILAYSSHPGLAVGIDYDTFYSLTYRQTGTDRNTRLKIWCAGANVRVFEEIPMGTFTLRSTTTTPDNTTRVELDIDVTSMSGASLNPDGDVTLVISVRKRGRDPAATGGFWGFVIHEIGETNLKAGGWDGIAIGDTAYQQDVPLNVALLQRINKNIDALVRYYRRGIAVCWPVKFAPPLSSVQWRGAGPFMWLSSPWSSKMTVIPRVGVEYDAGGNRSVNYNGKFDLSVFNDRQRRQIDSEQDTRDVLEANGLSRFEMNHASNRGRSRIFKDLPARAGAYNNAFVAFRGIWFDDLSAWETNQGNFFQFDDFYLGIIKGWLATETNYEDITDAIVGRHISLRQYGPGSIAGKGADPEDVDDLNSPSLPGSIARGDTGAPLADPGFTDSFFVFDIASQLDNVSFMSGWDRFISFSVSPAPPYVMENPGEATFRVRAGRHGWTRLYSVWINDEFEPDLSWMFAVPHRPPPSLLMQNYLTMLNSLLDSPHIVYGIGQNFGSHYPSPHVGGINYAIAWQVRDKHKEPTDPIYFLNRASFPFTWLRDPGSGERSRNVMGVRCRVSYSIYQTADSQGIAPSIDPALVTDPLPRLRLFWRVRFVDRPPSHPDAVTVLTGDWNEVTDVASKVRKREDVKSQSHWDAFAASSRGGWHFDGSTRKPGKTTAQYAWPPEIMGEDYPWAHFDFPVDFDVESFSYGNIYWAVIDCHFYSYEQDGSGASGGYGHSTRNYNLVVQSAACVADKYPKE